MLLFRTASISKVSRLIFGEDLHSKYMSDHIPLDKHVLSEDEIKTQEYESTATEHLACTETLLHTDSTSSPSATLDTRPYLSLLGTQVSIFPIPGEFF